MNYRRQHSRIYDISALLQLSCCFNHLDVRCSGLLESINEAGRGADLVAYGVIISNIEAPPACRRPTSNIPLLFGVILSYFADCSLLFGADLVTFLAGTP